MKRGVSSAKRGKVEIKEVEVKPAGFTIKAELGLNLITTITREEGRGIKRQKSRRKRREKKTKYAQTGELLSV